MQLMGNLCLFLQWIRARTSAIGLVLSSRTLHHVRRFESPVVISRQKHISSGWWLDHNITKHASDSKRFIILPF